MADGPLDPVRPARIMRIARTAGGTLRLAPFAVALVCALAMPACRRAPPPRDADLPPPPLDPAALERGAGACKDFYQYACGGWLAAAVVPADRATWDRGFSEIEERNARTLRRLLEAAAGGRGDGRDLASAKLGDSWASCMDGTAVDARGLAELSAAWARLDAAGDPKALFSELARLHASGISAPFELEVEPDARDAEAVLVLRLGGSSLSDPSGWTGDDAASLAVRTRFGAHLRKMLALAAVPPAEVERQAVAVERLERAFAALRAPRSSGGDVEGEPVRTTVAGLAARTPAFPWALFLEKLGAGGLGALSVAPLAQVERAAALLAEAPPDDVRAYLRFRLLETMADARALPRPFADERVAFESAGARAAGGPPPRWKHCVAEVDRALGFALGKQFVRARLGATARAGAVRIVAELEGALARDLETLAWMDGPTRARLKQKLARVRNEIGHPDAWPDEAGLKVSRTAYFRNVLAARRFETARKLAAAGKRVDRTAWRVLPQAAEVSYDPSRNELLVPAGILQPPFFNAAAPDPVNYGAFGALVGHELTHGFAVAGTVRRTDGWTPGVTREFERRAACFVDQYAALEPLPGVKLVGRLALPETIAEQGGVRLAFAAMQATLASRPEAEARAKFLGYTPEQQFFLSFAQARCSVARQEEPEPEPEPEARARARAARDPRAPTRFRVNGPLSNLPEFAEAFRCAPDDPMVRPELARCAVW